MVSFGFTLIVLCLGTGLYFSISFLLECVISCSAVVFDGKVQSQGVFFSSISNVISRKISPGIKPGWLGVW
jgi:membrane protein implicated in regulation of membrane protease activity